MKPKSRLVLAMVASVLFIAGCGGRPGVVERVVQIIASHMPCGERAVGVPKSLSPEMAEERCIISRVNPADEREWFSVMPVERRNCARLQAIMEPGNANVEVGSFEVYLSEHRSFRDTVYEYHAKYTIFMDGDAVRWKIIDRWTLNLENEASGICSIIVWMRPSYISDDVYGEDAPARFGICQDMGQGVEGGADGIVDSFISECYYRANYTPGWAEPDEPWEFTCADFNGQPIPAPNTGNHLCHNLPRPTPRPETWMRP